LHQLLRAVSDTTSDTTITYAIERSPSAPSSCIWKILKKRATHQTCRRMLSNSIKRS